MSLITSIKQQKDENRVNVYLDGKFGFGIDLDNFVKFNLKIGQELPQEKIDDIVQKSEHQKVLNKLLSFTTLRPRSEEEIKIWLRRKKVPQDMHFPLFDTLKRLELIDDYKFARWWIDQRNTFRPKGIKALKYELLKKGINRKIIDETLSEIDINEESIILEMLEKKRLKWERYEDEDRKQKMYEYLARQGFDWELVKKMVDKFVKKM